MHSSKRLFRFAIVSAMAAGLVCTFAGCGLFGGDDGDAGDKEIEFVTALPSCTGTWTGGQVFDGTGVVVDVPAGEVSSCANLDSAPAVAAIPSVGGDFPVVQSAETVVTAGGDARTFASNDGGLDVGPGIFVTITLPYDPGRLPVGSVETSTNTFVRILDPGRNMAYDVNGHLDVDAGTITIKVPGLPEDAVIAVIHRPGRVAVSAVGLAASAPRIWQGTSFPPWPGRDWCVIHDYDSAELRDAVRKAEGLADDPDPAAIAMSVLNRVAQAARAAQATYEGLGLRAPWLYVSEDPEGPCGDRLGSTPRYEIHVQDADGSYYSGVDPDEATGPGDRHYGRIYIKASRIGDDSSAALGTVKASVAHEMLHSIQMGYEILRKSVEGLNEGTATVAGIYMDQGAINVRTAWDGEVFRLADFLMTPADHAYSNQDFFAFVARRYGGSSLAFLPIVFQAMRDQISSATSAATTQGQADAIMRQPGSPNVHRALDAAVTTWMPGIGLREIYMDFLLQRGLQHASESVFNRPGETTYGLASELFGVSVGDWAAPGQVTASMSECVMSKTTVKFDNVCPFAARAIQITATDVPSPARNAVLNVQVTSSRPDSVVAYAWREGDIQTIDGPTQFDAFGAYEGEQLPIVIGVAGITGACDTSISVEISMTCDAKPPEGEDPMLCGASGIPACNDVPALYYWRRGCQEYTGSHWATDWGTLQNMCGLTTGAEWCNSGCSRSNVLGTCTYVFGEGGETVIYFYTTVDYAAQDFDPASYCAQDGGAWGG